MSSNKVLRDNKNYCPHCNACLQGDEIPQKLQKRFGATHYSRRHSYYDLELDRVTKHCCPDCEGEWDRE